MRKVWGLASLGLILSGCSAQPDLMPLKQGATWVYEVTTPIGKSVRTVVAQSSASVGHLSGYELVSESGASQVAWNGRSLVAGKLSGTFYDPPLPILLPDLTEKPVEWHGKIIGPLGTENASAKIVQKLVERPVLGRKTKCTHVAVTIKLPKSETVTELWFASGYGMVLQEERRDGVLINKLTYVSGP